MYKQKNKSDEMAYILIYVNIMIKIIMAIRYYEWRLNELYYKEGYGSVNASSIKRQLDTLKKRAGIPPSKK